MARLVSACSMRISLISCWVILEPPWVSLPIRLLISARLVPSMSIAPCSKNRESSIATIDLRMIGATSLSSTSSRFSS